MAESKESTLSRVMREYVVDPYKRMRDKAEKELRTEQYLGTTQEEADELKKQMQESAERNKPRPPGMKKGGKVGSASKRADGCAQRGKTRGKIV